MADSVTVQIRGLEDLEKSLQAMEDRIRRKYVRKALTEGSEAVRAEAARLAPSGKKGAVMMGGHIIGFDGGPKLRDNIASKVSVGARSATATVGIDYRKVSHGHLVEFGSKPHKIKTKVNGRTVTVQHPGARKQPFMRPAYDKKGDRALEVMLNILYEAVEKKGF